ncbi:Acetyltransferase (GNAT) family protein [Salinimicrobium catena]|uniref:Acetyltransferase (GNAT) family protein n=1 Tax=Salinimicrobium catena TaxID=390640 RepID=A0A1H5PCW4_9FLAO|nr:GNAT family N-acetyltransferase [Salinimicrobium catena]SDL79538.1 Acetyltransferase (GNAT) family protein [Salinimicrobium catena]SEF11733.1 Acetyltransferase (GNAT) family protein [Salinimicrobium catena]
MNIRNLAATGTADIVECLLSAFSNYFVQLPSEVYYWEDRFKAARVDLTLSFGMFDEDKLVGFIINGIDHHNGKLTAFNSGTGVLPAYRGKAVVDQLYEHAIPLFKERGVEKCMLEVIQENERALKVYKRIGFDISRSLTAWKGSLENDNSRYDLKEVNFQEILDKGLYRSELYSWDNMAEAVLLSEANKKSYLVSDKNGELKGYFTIGANGMVAQVFAVEKKHHSEVVKSIAGVSPEVRFGNIPLERQKLIGSLQKLGFENTVNQYEMEYLL